METVTTKKNWVSPSLSDLGDMTEDLIVHDVYSDKYILCYKFGESVSTPCSAPGWPYVGNFLLLSRPQFVTRSNKRHEKKQNVSCMSFPNTNPWVAALCMTVLNRPRVSI